MSQPNKAEQIEESTAVVAVDDLQETSTPSTPNAENLRQVAQVIRDHHDQFDLNDWATDDRNPLDNCGTVCCICGWTNAVIASEDGGEFDPFNSEKAIRYLGLDRQTAEDLFTPSDSEVRYGPWPTAKNLGLYPKYKCYYDATAEEAANVLEAIANGRIIC